MKSIIVLDLPRETLQLKTPEKEYPPVAVKTFSEVNQLITMWNKGIFESTGLRADFECKF